MTMGVVCYIQYYRHCLVCTPSELVPVTHNVKRGETIQHQCQRGFLEVTCNMTGTWDLSGIEDNNCSEIWLYQFVIHQSVFVTTILR